MIGMGPTAVEAGTLDLDPFPYTNCGLKRWAERPIHNVGNTVYRLSNWAMRTAARVPGLARGEQLGKGPRQRPPRAAGLFHWREMLRTSRRVDLSRAFGGLFGPSWLRCLAWSSVFFLRLLVGFAPGLNGLSRLSS